MDIASLIRKLADAESRLSATTFVAPCVAGGRVHARVDGLVKRFSVHPADFAGWGVFRPAGDDVASLEEVADLPLVGRYLRLLPALRMILVRKISDRTWLATCQNESDARQRFGSPAPVRLHLVDGGAPFDPVLCRFDGAAWWFEDLDRRADPTVAPALRTRLARLVPPEALRVPGMTPEMRGAYEITYGIEQEALERKRRRSPDYRLGEALRRFGGELEDFTDRGEWWVVEWRTRDGRRHTSAIDKDLTVRGAGVCLSGRERDFDLQSLVGVMEGAPDWYDTWR